LTRVEVAGDRSLHNPALKPRITVNRAIPKFDAHRGYRPDPLVLLQFFEPWTKARFENNVPKTWLWYRTAMGAILKYKPLASAPLDKITSEKISEFAVYRQSLKMRVSSVNNTVRALLRMLRLAVEWGALEVAPQIKMLPGERHCERVGMPEEEARYLAAAAEPLASIAAVLIDTGMRPEECFLLCWDAITRVNGRHGTLFVTHGRTAAARRVLPMTPRVRAILESRWERAGKPVGSWIWPAPTRSGQHRRVKSQKATRKGIRDSRQRGR
jgi:integrase